MSFIQSSGFRGSLRTNIGPCALRMLLRAMSLAARIFAYLDAAVLPSRLCRCLRPKYNGKLTSSWVWRWIIPMQCTPSTSGVPGGDFAANFLHLSVSSVKEIIHGNRMSYRKPFWFMCLSLSEYNLSATSFPWFWMRTTWNVVNEDTG